MKVKKNYTKDEILSGIKIGFEFEFFSSLDVFKTARELAKATSKRVVVPLSLSSLDEPKPLYHSPVAPTSTVFKLEPDYSGGKKMCELVTGPMKYSEARNIMIKVFEWIQANGYTNERCAIHVNMSLDGNVVPTKYTIQNINIPKFILSFDENVIFDKFPKRKDSVYARSIKQIRPNRVLFYSPSLEEFSRATLTLPADEKYYGVNFLKAEKGYLEYRYLGGQDYEKKAKIILDLIDYMAIHLYDTLNFEGFSEKEKAEFKKLIDLDKKVYEGFVKYEHFAKKFPDIKVSVDLNQDPQILESFWGVIREKLYDAIITGKMRKGEFNYDTDMGRFQLKNTKLSNCKLSDFEFAMCKVEGIISRSWFFNCEVANSRVSESHFVKGNTVDFSKIVESELHIDNTLNDCYIENKKIIINCEINRGVIRNGEIGKLAKISKDTMIVEGQPTESANTGSSSYSDPAQDKKNKEKKKDRE
jgi:hypothetical protein